MIRNYLLVAFRQLRRQRLYASIMIGGFALSIAACILISLYIRDELSYDRSVPQADRVFRIVNRYGDDNFGNSTYTQAPLAADLVDNYPQVEKAGRLMRSALFYGAGSNQIRKADQAQNTYEEGFAYADQSLLDVLGTPMIYGKPGHALEAPHSLVLTRRMAEKYFPHQDPVGQVFYLNNDTRNPYTVGGVIEDYGSRSSIQYDFLLTLKGVELWPGEQTGWGTTNYATYVRLKPGTDAAAFQRQLTASELQRHLIAAMKSWGITDVDEKVKHYVMALQPVRDVYLKSGDINNDAVPFHGDNRLVWMFGGIACFILVIACVNFVNLATARSAGRAKEIGLRKVVGSYRSGLVRQFLTESMLYSLLSFVAALVLAWALLPFFNHLTGKSLTLPWDSVWFAPVLLGSAFLLGIVSGFYPAWYLSGFEPARVLKGEVSRGVRNARLRSILVVFQFTTSIILIVGTLVVYRQMQYILHAKVGFDKDQVLVVQGTGTIPDIQAFKSDLLRLPQAKSVTVGDFLPVNIPGAKRNGEGFYMDSLRASSKPVFGQFWIADYDYIPTMGMELVAGRNFSRSMATDTAAAIINQSLATQLGLGSHAVGSVINNGAGPLRVIGVVRDFHFETFREKVRPVCLFLGISPTMVSIKVQSVQAGDLAAQVAAVWKKYAPNQALRYTFLDDGFRQMYADVTRAGTLLTCFAVLAIVIACLGLFALSSFMAEQRTKEIGIRKVLGASAGQLFVLMSRGFVVLILVSLLIATPIAWWAMTTWLRDFKYRQELDLWLFFVVGGIALLIALATTSAQSIRAALENPIKSLKTE
ncbi:ABC transporter permease [Dinghuibacter silviterrae]|uniref:Putative ABC transport system permease protein n=1 Tax=Dinghuibacter silviterrae TaxID=1539049 RepID=A0A4R8DUE5_9BACT|nr:ABC transporter permease [Dinghuibacter silviterrae]TDX01990.1 putative ABC transport system permease protein [Dinghuibacter silviterrae]